MFKFLVLLYLCLAVGWSEAFGTGNGITGACSTMEPGHGGSPKNNDKSPYTLSVIQIGATSDYTVTLSGNGVPFKGFLIQALNQQKQIIGQFYENANGRLQSCSGKNGGAISHNSADVKPEVIVHWSSEGFTGPVEFKYSVVQDFSNYYVELVEKLTI